MRFDAERLHYRNRDRSTVIGLSGMVCTSQPLASLAGVDILKAGGNAIDAAIAANAVLSVVEPMSCGPGGDLFALVWREKERRLYGLNASGRAPYDWSLTDAHELSLDEIPLFGPLSWSVPGCVSGWEALRLRFGHLSLDKILERAICHARAGFPVTEVIARQWATVDFKQYPTLARTFAPGGRSPRYGEVFVNHEIATFFEALVRHGADSFYRGEIAKRIVEFSHAHGGRLSLRDLADHAVTWVEPVSSNYRGYDVWEIPPNGQGIAVLQMLNLLEHFDIGALTPNSVEHLHLFIEAKKLAYEDRAEYYADPDFADVPVRELISKEYAQDRVRLIDVKRAANSVVPGQPRRSADTVYLTTADSEGNMVSLIQSIFHGFGSREVPDGLGFALQNRGALFSLHPEHPNCLQPRKRPFNTIIPGFVTRYGEPLFSFGVMGGDFQPQGQVQVLMNLIDFGLSPQQAGEQPRISHDESSTPTGRLMTDGGVVSFEPGFPDAVVTGLAARGHRIAAEPGVFGGYQGIWRENDPLRYFGGSDSRKDGCAIGY